MEAWLAARGWSFTYSELAGDLDAGVEGLTSTAARSLARKHVALAAKDARAMPTAEFSAVLTDGTPEPLVLATRFRVEVLAVMLRMAAMPGAEVGLVVCEGARAQVVRKSAAEGVPCHASGRRVRFGRCIPR